MNASYTEEPSNNTGSIGGNVAPNSELNRRLDDIKAKLQALKGNRGQ
jgi:hypothetical protein